MIGDFADIVDLPAVQRRQRGRSDIPVVVIDRYARAGADPQPASMVVVQIVGRRVRQRAARNQRLCPLPVKDFHVGIGT